MSEYVTYNKGVPKCNVEKSLELQQMILNPMDFGMRSQGLRGQYPQIRTHSAVKAAEKRLTVEKAIELQKKIIELLTKSKVYL